MTKTSGSMDLSSELTATEKLINQITQGTIMDQQTDTTSTTTTKPAPAKKAPAKKAPVKKAAKKAPAKKAPAKKKAAPATTSVPDGHTLLADICAKAKVEPTIARRRLRNAGIERREGSQYSWPAGQVAKITAIIKGE